MNDDQSELTAGTAEAESVDYAAKKRRIILLLLVYSAILGAIIIFFPMENTPLDFVVSLPLLILAISWCFVDAGERHHRIGRLMRLSLVLLFVVGFPLYIFQTRGIGGFKTLAVAVLLVLAMVACLSVTAFATGYLGYVVGILKLE